jgi:hypothetical protein
VVVTDKTVKELFGFTVDQNDDRFFNNLYLTKKALSTYDEHHFRITADGNDLGIKLVESADGWWLEMNIDSAWQAKRKRPLVTSKLLGRVTVPDAPFGNRDGTPYRIDADYFGEKRDENNPAPGALRAALSGKVSVKVWPRK